MLKNKYMFINSYQSCMMYIYNKLRLLANMIVKVQCILLEDYIIDFVI